MGERNEQPLPCRLERYGIVDYAEALRRQEQLVAERQSGLGKDALLLLEHPRVVTLGRNARAENLLLSEPELRARGYELFEVGRGGDVTYHGPGQLVGYPILCLAGGERDAHAHLRRIEELLMRVLKDFGIAGFRHPPHSGVWVERDRRRLKIAAIGVRLSRWVSSHGFALNVCCDLKDFAVIVPCGIRDFGVTSMAEILQTAVKVDDVIERVAVHFGPVFGRRLDAIPHERA